jgi:hypothetical protein
VAEGIEFLATPDSYHEDPQFRARIGESRAPIDELAKRGSLVDRDEDGYPPPIFAKPVVDRPTVFVELIERHGSLGLGSGTSRPASKPSSASRPHPATSDPTGLGAPMHLMSSTENKPTVSAPDGAPSDGALTPTRKPRHD